VSSLKELSDCVQASTLTGVNIPQIVGSENGPPDVPLYDWQAFLAPIFKQIPGIKGHHHFSFSAAAPGVLKYREFWSSEDKEHVMLKIPVAKVATIMVFCHWFLSYRTLFHWFRLDHMTTRCKSVVQLNVYDLLQCYNIIFVSNILFTLSAFYVAMSGAERSPRTVSVTRLVRSASVVPLGQHTRLLSRSN